MRVNQFKARVQTLRVRRVNHSSLKVHLCECDASQCAIAIWNAIPSQRDNITLIILFSYLCNEYFLGVIKYETLFYL